MSRYELSWYRCYKVIWMWPHTQGGMVLNYHQKCIFSLFQVMLDQNNHFRDSWNCFFVTGVQLPGHRPRWFGGSGFRPGSVGRCSDPRPSLDRAIRQLLCWSAGHYRNSAGTGWPDVGILWRHWKKPMSAIIIPVWQHRICLSRYVWCNLQNWKGAEALPFCWRNVFF